MFEKVHWLEKKLGREMKNSILPTHVDILLEQQIDIPSMLITSTFIGWKVELWRALAVIFAEETHLTVSFF